MNEKNISMPEGRSLVLVAALCIIFAAAIYAKSIITPLLLAILISIISAQPLSWLEKKRTPKWLALILVITGLILFFFGFMFLIGGSLASFSANVSKYASTLTTISNSFIQYLNGNGLNIPKDKLSDLIQPAKVLQFTASALNDLFNMVASTFLIFLIILFILMEYDSFSIKAKAILSGTEESVAYFSTITQNIRHYLVIKSLFGLATGVFIYVTMLIIGVDYPLLWALIAGLLNYIPNIGSIIASIPAVLFALVQLGTGGALWTLASFVLVHNILGNFVEPRVMGKGLGLSTLVVFLSLLFWGFIFGPVGMFLSVPITMTIKIILEQDEKTRWFAILLGTSEEAEISLQHKRHAQKKPLKNPGKQEI